MKRTLCIALMALLVFACKDKVKETTVATSDKVEETFEKTEVQDEWTVLFDGTSFDGWKGYKMDDVPEYWKLEDGAMVFYPPTDRKKGVSYNLVSTNEFHNFVLSLEWKIAEAGNSGVMWGVQEMAKYGQPYNTGPEVQVLDNEKHPDGKNGTSHQAGALYDMVAPSEDVTKPAGEWNSMSITVDYSNNVGVIVLNGVEIVNFPLANEAWDTMVSKSKFASWEDFGKYPKGKIALQDHGDMVAYRNIRIKEL